MICCQGCESGIETFNDYWSPEDALRKAKTKDFYANHPLLARAIFVPLAVISGIAKGILFPVISAINTLILSLMAIVKVVQGKHDGGHWQAAGLSHLALTVSVLFMVLSAYYCSINTAAAIYLTGIAISVTVHVYRACKAPE